MDGKYISLITFTKKGDPIATPVWFVEKDDKLFVMTDNSRYKVRRINNNPKVKIAKSNMRGKVTGSYIEGEASIVSDELIPSIKMIFKKKYFSSRFMFRKDNEKKKAVCIEITVK